MCKKPILKSSVTNAFHERTKMKRNREPLSNGHILARLYKQTKPHTCISYIAFSKVVSHPISNASLDPLIHSTNATRQSSSITPEIPQAL